MILLTAFKGRNNASRTLLDRVGGQHIAKALLTNSFDACKQELIESISSCHPKYVISLGRKPVINRLYIETTACNENFCIKTGFDLSLLQDSLKRYGIPFKISLKPSNFLCNHVYYYGLNYIEKNTPKTKMIFIHVPDMKRFQNIDSVVFWLNNFCGELL